MKEYPSTQETYGIVVKAETTTAELGKQRKALEKLDGDNFVLLSVKPHDVKSRPDWEAIDEEFRTLARRSFDVEYVSESDIKVLARKIGKRHEKRNAFHPDVECGCSSRRCPRTAGRKL
jgi:hypothetical protein